MRVQVRLKSKAAEPASDDLLEVTAGGKESDRRLTGRELGSWVRADAVQVFVGAGLQQMKPPRPPGVRTAP